MRRAARRFLAAWRAGLSDPERARRERAQALLHALTVVDMAISRMEHGRTRQHLQGCSDQLHKAFPLLTER